MTKKEAKEKRRDDILEAAIDVVIEKGYENTSMNEIAARAGISKGGLYHHFLSKDLVMLYANEKLMQPINELLLEAKKNPVVTDGLKSYIHDYLKYWLDRKRELAFFSLSMAKAMTQRDIFKLYERFTENYISSFADFFQQGITCGEFIPHDTRARAVALISALDGLLCYMVLDRKLKLADMVEYYEGVFLKPIYHDNSV